MTADTWADLYLVLFTFLTLCRHRSMSWFQTGGIDGLMIDLYELQGRQLNRAAGPGFDRVPIIVQFPFPV